MNVETIILDEFDQLLDDSQIHFVEKITHYAPRDHQLIYMSATTKFDQEKIAPNTRTIDLSDQKLDNIQHFYMQVEQRNRVELLRKLAHVEDFRGLVSLTACQTLEVQRKNYSIAISWLSPSLVMSMWNSEKSS